MGCKAWMVLVAILVALVSCSTKPEVRTLFPQRAESLTAQPTGACVAAIFTGFPGVSEYVTLVGTDSYAFAETSLSMPQVQADDVDLSWSPGFGCVGAYTYCVGNVVVLPGSKYAVTAGILCADWNGCVSVPAASFENDSSITWHGQRMPVNNASRNATFRWQGATLVVNEVVQRADGSAEVNAVHLLLPGKNEVRVSHVELNAPLVANRLERLRKASQESADAADRATR